MAEQEKIFVVVDPNDEEHAALQRAIITAGQRDIKPKVRVFIESRDQEDIWSTIGVSEDIIEASWHALADSFQFKLASEKQIRSRQIPAQEELPLFVK